MTLSNKNDNRVRSLGCFAISILVIGTACAQAPLSCTSLPSGVVGTFPLGAGDFSLDFWVQMPPNTPQTMFPENFETVLRLTNSCADTNTFEFDYIGYYNPEVFQYGQPSGEGSATGAFLPVSIIDGSLHHVVLIRQAPNVGIYVDGVSGSPSVGWLYTADLTTGQLSVGIPSCVLGQGNPHYYFSSFTGQVQDLLLYNRALTSQEIASTFTSQSPGQCGLSAPTNLQAKQIDVSNGTQILLTWDYGSDPIDGFVIEREPPTSTGSFVPLVALAGQAPPGPQLCPPATFVNNSTFTLLAPSSRCLIDTVPDAWATYSYQIQAVQGSVQSAFSNTATGYQLNKSWGTGMQALFVPAPLHSIQEVATTLGFDHFNWISILNHDPQCYLEYPLYQLNAYDTSKGPTNGAVVPAQGATQFAPHFDPPLGGYTQYGLYPADVGPSDGLPYFWDEQQPWYLASSYSLNPEYSVNGLPAAGPQSSSDTAAFADTPENSCLPGNSPPSAPSEYWGFFTTLVGVNAPMGGTPLSLSPWYLTKSAPLASFAWNTTYNGVGGGVTPVRSLNVDPPLIPGTGGVFNVSSVDIGDLPLDVRQLLIQAGVQGVSTSPSAGSIPPMTAAFLSGSQGENGWYTGPVTVTLIATDLAGPSQIAATTYSVDGGSLSTYTSPFTVSGVGTHTIQFSSVDIAGLAETPVNSQQFTIVLGAPTTSFAGAPASAAYGTSFTVAATTNASTTATITAGGACSIAGSTVTITSGTGVCQLTANWAADANYSSASASQSTTALQAAPTITVAPYSVMYDGSAHTATAIATGVNGVNLISDVTLTGTTHTNAGTYASDAWSFTDPVGNYASANGTVSDMITQAAAIINLSNLTQTYSGSPEAVTVSTTPPGLGITTSYAGIAPTSYGPSSTAPISPGSYSVLTTVVDPNYAGQQSGTLTINQVDPTLSLSLMTGMPATTPYGTTVYFDLAMASSPQCPTGTAQLYVDGTASGSPTVLSGSSCAQPLQFQTAALAAGVHSIYASYSGDPYFEAENSATLSYTVTQDATTVTLGSSGSSANVGQPLTFTATVVPVSPDNAQPPAGSVLFYDGTNQIGVGSTLTSASPYTSTFTTSALSAGPHSISASFVDSDGNFTSNSSPVAVETVNLIVPTINWTPSPTKFPYGTQLAVTQLNAAAVDGSGNPINGNFSYNFPFGTVLPAGTVNLTATFTPSDPTTYAVNAATITLTVAPVALTVTPNNLSMTFGANLPTLTYQIAGFVNNDPSSVVTGAASCSTTATSASPVGSYSINCSQGTLAASNYTFQFVSGTLAVTEATQTIIFTPPASPVTYGVSPITLSATGGGSGNAIVFSVVSGPGSISGNMLTITGAGTVVVAANQAGNSNYAAAVQVTQSIVITKASQTITFNAVSAQKVGATVSLSASATSGLAVSFSSLTPAVCTVSGTTAKLANTGTCSIQASQPGNADYSPATSATQSFTVSSAANFTITPDPASETIPRGVVAGFILQVTSVGGFKGSVKLSCSGGPAGSECIDLPQTVQVNGTAYAVSGILFPEKTTPGTYTITFTGTSGLLTNTATAKFTVK